MLENPLLILVDMDGVVADFERGFLESWQNRYPQKPFIPLNERRTFSLAAEYAQIGESVRARALYSEAGFFASLPAIDGAVEALYALDKLVNIRICTSPLTKYQDCVLEKYCWVDQNLGSKWVDRIIMTRDKTLVSGDILIDDRPTLFGVQQPSWEHIIFDQPYNREALDKRRLNWQNYREVLGL